ncbi:Lead, cadmium, zinc and mercury transporting ATPase [Methanosarcina barkeri str. Wiesmoor]|uniref:Lead, cadmium, zinc and mercury transporting ATPase n=2 Tax=Methanosarcina barkeri TaxID=2208 RepID=A0A0E3LKF6_METBA|nr:Lead, cadmium, zinc and mercury transporting ATPase [Methanosarcina barkeri str. Wiesmoor]
MQADNKETGIGISKTQVNESSSHDNDYNSGGDMQGNSRKSHEESGNKPAGKVHRSPSESQKMRPEQKSLDQGQSEEVKLGSSEQREEMKHEQHGENEHEGHELQEELKHDQPGEMKRKQHDETKYEQHDMKDETKHEGMEHEGTEHEGMKHEGMEHEGMEHKGHEAAGGKGHGNHHAHMLEDFKRRFIVSFVLTFPILLLSPMIQDFFNFELRVPGAAYLTFLLSSVVYLYGGYPFLKGIKDELSEKSPGMMTLIAVAISVAYFYSSAVVFGLHGKVFFWELATLIDVMLIGHWLEMRSVMGASRALEELVKIMPSVAHLKKNGEVVDIGVDQLKVGDNVLIKPGEKVPVDGIVVEGTSSVNESMLTGESKPVTKKPGNDVIGGSINGEAAFVVRVEKTGKDTYLSQVVELVRAAQESKSKTQDLANRAAMYLTIIALTVGALTFILWLLFGQQLVFALERAVTVMVITCPHALGLAIPLVVAVSTSIAAKSGLLIRDRQAFERARNLQAIIFDKTGTLTEGRFGVTDIVSFSGEENGTGDDGGEGNERILSLAASLEASSEHPIATGILESAKEKGVQIQSVEEFSSIPGKGVQGLVEGKRFLVVSPGYLEENGIALKNEKVEEIEAQGKTVVFLLEEDRVLGAVALADIIRKESRKAISKLKSMGIKCLMLTGDNRYVAAWVSKELELDDYFAEVLPHEKAEKVKEVQAEYTTGMVGDGVNDAPALAQADVGIAIGAGTDVAIETADIVLVKNDPRDVVDIIDLSRKTYSKMYQNLLWATWYNVFAIPLAAGILYGYGILLSPAMGAVFMSLSTVIVAINAQALKME